MTFPAGMLGTFMELYSAVVDDFAAYLFELPTDQLKTQAMFDGKSVSIESVLDHVVTAGCYYARDIGCALRRTDDTSELVLDLRADPIDAIRSLIPRTKDAIDGYWELTEPELAKLTVLTSWKQIYSVDQLLEHAIVHIPWHKRQCKRILERAAKAL